PMAQMVVRLSSVMALIIVQTSSGSIRNVASLSNVTRAGVAPIFASTVRPIAVPDGTVMVMYGTCDPFVLARSAFAQPAKGKGAKAPPTLTRDCRLQPCDEVRVVRHRPQPRRRVHRKPQHLMPRRFPDLRHDVMRAFL